MVVLLDANVVLNCITGREDRYSEACREIMALCSRGTLDGVIAFHTISIVWYALRIPATEKRKWLREICSVLTVIGASHAQVLEAIGREDFRDFEDCLQEECAYAAGADFIVTCNKKDFTASRIKTVTPEEFLAITQS